MWSRLAVVLLLLIPGALGQVTLVQDASEDVRMGSSNGNLQAGQGGDQWPNLDILEAGVHAETDTSISFFINVTDIEPEQDPNTPKSNPTYFFAFRYGDQGYRAVATVALTSPWDTFTGPPVAKAMLEIEYEDDVYNPLADIEVEVDHSNDQIIMTVDRSLIRDHNEAPLGRGEVLHDIEARSRAMGWFGVPILVGQNFIVDAGPPMFFDVAPDRNEADSYTTVAGIELRNGDLVSASSDPVRWTNGEATTFVFFIRVLNQGTKDHVVNLGHEGIDPEWNWQIAFSDQLIVPAGAAINVTYHVAIPFGHFHGRLSEFRATFEDETGTHWAKQPLAVYWPKIPQPAGHHPEVWMHSRHTPREEPMQSIGDAVHGWFSAAAPGDELFDEAVPIPADRIDGPDQTGSTEGRSLAQWTMRLEPSLRMGLDFDLSSPASGTVVMNFPYQIQAPTLTMDLVHIDQRTVIPKEKLLLRGSVSETDAITGEHAFVFTDILPRDVADIIRHQPRAELEWRFNLTGVFVGRGFENPEDMTPTIIPTGTQFTLPLFEYHDPLTTKFKTDASVDITVGPEGQEKKVNAGEQVVFTFDLHYQGTLPSGFKVELSGPNSEWASVLGDKRFEMEPGDTREVAVSIAPPVNAGTGSIAEVTIKAVGTVNAAVQAGMIVRAEVTPVDVADETELAKEKAQNLSTASEEKSLVWIWWVIIPIVLIAGAGVAIWRLRPQWLPFLP